MCQQNKRHEESASEDEWTDEEEELPALDHVDPFLYFADTLSALQAQLPSRFQVAASHHQEGAKEVVAALRHPAPQHNMSSRQGCALA